MVLGVEGLKNNLSSLCDGRDVKLDATPSPDPGAAHVQKSALNSQVGIHKVKTALPNFGLVCEHSFAYTQLLFQHMSTLYRHI